MTRRIRLFVYLSVLVIPVLLMGGAARASTPVVLSIVEGRDTGAARSVLTIVGAGLTAAKEVSLLDADMNPVNGTTLILRSKTMIVLALPEVFARGDYTVRLIYGKTPTNLDTPITVAGADAWTASGSNAVFQGGRVGIGTASPAATLHVVGDDGVLCEGTYGSGGIPATGAGARLMWYSGKAAFRAGRVIGTQWDDSSVGANSAALGYSTTASGTASTALGGGTTASALYSTAMGQSTVASGQDAIAMGNFATASGFASIAMGNVTVANSQYAVAMGSQTTASGGLACTAMGSATTASGGTSTALGDTTTASGAVSTATGYHTIASGNASTSMGDSTTAQAYGSLVLGRYNVVAGTTNSWVSTEPALVVGNGSSAGSPSNAFTLLKDGNLTIAGTLTQNSDARLKTDIAPLRGALSRLAGVRGVTYRFKDDRSGPAGSHIGLLAQEVREAFPELVKEDSRGTLSVAYGNFTAVLVEAVKEQEAVIESQARDLAAQKAGNEALEKRLARLEALVEGKK